MELVVPLLFLFALLLLNRKDILRWFRRRGGDRRPQQSRLDAIGLSHRPDLRVCEHRWPRSGGCARCAEIELEKQRAANERAEFERRSRLHARAENLRAQQVKALKIAILRRTADYFSTMDSWQFEDAVADLFRHLGYKVKQTAYSNDGGKDAILVKNGQKFLAECKRYAPGQPVGRRDLQILFAAMMEERASGGFLVTTGRFAEPAREYAAKNGIELYDGDGLPLLAAKAFPPQDLTMDVMCSDCAVIVRMRIAVDPRSMCCRNGHLVTNTVTLATLGLDENERTVEKLF